MVGLLALVLVLLLCVGFAVVWWVIRHAIEDDDPEDDDPDA